MVQNAKLHAIPAANKAQLISPPVKYQVDRHIAHAPSISELLLLMPIFGVARNAILGELRSAHRCHLPVRESITLPSDR